jgi:hypothetical protein
MKMRFSWIGLAGAALAVTSPALAAPTPHECAAASEDASTLQKQEKLGAAKDRFLVCADAACPAEIREECAHRVSEVADAIPSVVFDVKDASGNDVSAVKVSMDGTLLVDHLGAAAVPIDPGEHVFHFEGADPSQAVDKSFVVRDGEKNRHLAVTLGGAPVAPVASPAAAAAPASDQPSQSTWSGQKTAALVTGGIGIVGIGVGAIFGAMTFSQWSTAQSECTNASNCGPGSQAQNDKNTATTSATVSDVGFIAGGVLVATAAVLWFTAPSGLQVQVAPAASPQSAGLSLRGTF